MNKEASAPVKVRQRDSGQRILDVAEKLAQTRGFNGFSYADIAEQLLVTKASLHYHFPSKERLGCALIERYALTFDAALAAADRECETAREKLRRYAELYAAVIRENRICLCGMLAAEYATLPESMQRALRSFFDSNERWLTIVLGAGRRSGELSFDEPPRDRARLLVAVLEGALMLARTYSDVPRFSIAAANALDDLFVRGAS
jgi:TetR/AcrR family transcriptional regulator, transcriptional repressor for nem operon